MPEKAELIVDGKKLSVSNLNKVLYPKAGFTKGQVIDYYIRIAPVLLPHLRDRPLTMKRYPNGVDAEFFYEKNCPSHRPKWVKTAKVWSEGNNRISITVWHRIYRHWFGPRLADLELHTSLAKKKDVARPTMMVFDLDPGAPADIVQCCQVGLWLRDLLEKMKLKSFAKTSGSKGLQVYAPLNTAVSFDQTKDLSRALPGTWRANIRISLLLTCPKRCGRERYLLIGVRTTNTRPPSASIRCAPKKNRPSRHR